MNLSTYKIEKVHRQAFSHILLNNITPFKQALDLVKFLIETIMVPIRRA